MFYVYILYSRKIKQVYVGQTNNLDKRLKEHFDGKNFSTKNKLPLSLIHVEIYQTRSDAMKREKFFKSLSGSKLKSKILKKFLADGLTKI
jgi:putative endonuclease